MNCGADETDTVQTQFLICGDHKQQYNKNTAAMADTLGGHP